MQTSAVHSVDAGRTPATGKAPLTRKNGPPTKGNLPPHLTPGNPGNSGGKKGRSGRRPDWFKELAEKLLANRSTRKAMRRVLRNPDHPAWASLRKQLEDRAFGKPKETVEHQGKLTLEQLLGASRDAALDDDEGDA